MTFGTSGRYFVKEVYFGSRDLGWVTRYLENRDERITAILAPFLGNEFWKNYAKVRLNFEKEGWLVLRVKSVSSEFVCFTQAWTEEKYADEFTQLALRGVNMMKILETQGISSQEKTYLATDAELGSLISSLQKRPHILQVVADKWRTPDMKIGDPMKIGKLYLPFPD